MPTKILWVAVAAFAAAACTKTVNLKEVEPLVLTASPPKPPPPPPPPKRVEVKKEKIQVNEKIHFEFNKAEIREESFGLVDEIAQVITGHPELLKIRIEGHTDSVGSHEYNMDLSQRRADAVRAYLIEKGVEPDRLITKGYSFDQPIATNDTDEGRAKNRRVEFTILERDEDAAEPAGEGEPAEEAEPTEEAEPAGEGEEAGEGEAAGEAEEPEAPEQAEEPEEAEDEEGGDQ